MDLFTTRPPATEPAKVGEHTFLGVIWGGVAVSFLFLAMRLVARWNSFRRLYADDGFIIFAWLLALLTAIDWQVVARYMFQFTAITSGQLWPPPATFVADTERYYKGSVVVLVFFYTSLWAVKISFLLFFKRLSQNVMRLKVLWWCVFFSTIATYLVCIGDIQYSCLAAPLAKLVSHCSNDWSVNFQQVTLKFNCAVDVLTDLMIIIIPISMLWRVQMSLQKKIALTGIFSLVIITMVFAIVRVTVISFLTRQPDTSWSYMWSSIEQCVAIIVSCLASFRGLFTQHDSRSRTPKYTPPENHSGNLFLQRIRKPRPPDQSLLMTGLSEVNAPVAQHSTSVQVGGPHVPGTRFTDKGSAEHVVPLQGVYVEREVELSHEMR